MRPRVCAYLTRNMPVVLRDRLRAAARGRKESMEETLAQALAIGLAQMEDGAPSVVKDGKLRLNYKDFERDDNEACDESV